MISAIKCARTTFYAFSFALLYACSDANEPPSKHPISTPDVAATARHPEINTITNKTEDQLSIDLTGWKDICKKARNLLPQDIDKAIALCNNSILEYDTQESDKQSDSPINLHSVLSSVIYESIFGSRCLLNENERKKLTAIAASNLDEKIKNHLLVLCSKGTQGDADASAKVLEIAKGTVQNPQVIAPIVTDIAIKDPPLAIKTLLSEKWRPEYSKATARLYSEYIMKDPEAGSKAVNELARDSEAFQWAAAGLVQTIRGVDPEASVDWRKQITDAEAGHFADALTYSMKIDR